MTQFRTYIGTKIIQAKPELGDPNNPRTAGVDGYRVVYGDSYSSWSPKEAFEQAYRLTDRMTFGDALVMLEAGRKVTNPEAEGRYLQFAQTRKGDPLNRHVAQALYWFSHEHPERPLYPFLATGLLLQSKDWQVVE